MVSWLLTCNRLLHESSGAVIWLAIDRASQVKLAQIFMENTMVQTRSHEKIVIDKITGSQGTAWRSIFAHGPRNRCFARNLAFERTRHRSYRRECSIALRMRQVSCNFVD